MMKNTVMISLSAAMLLSSVSALAWKNQSPGKAGKLPDLTKSCAKECPDAQSNDDAFRCVEKMEKKRGETAFKKQHRTCYNAHEKYEKKKGKEEAGQVAQ